MSPPVTDVNTVKAETPRPPFNEISMRSQGQRVPVIMYHDIIERRDRNAVWFDCTTEEFEEQMKQLQEWGAVPISLDQLYGHLTKGDPIPENAIVLTFDDNYQGFYDRALPILRQYHYPAAVFVHTGFVGNKEGVHPKMDWAELQELVKDPLITIGNHTITHPSDLTKVDPDQQRREIFDAKAELEKQLGKKIDYFAYPEGNNDETTQGLVREAGHKMAFTVHNGPAEESPNIVAVDRYIHTKLKNAWEDREKSLQGGALGVLRVTMKDTPVRYQEIEQDGIKLGLITGGMPSSVMSETREGVLDFIKRTPGSVAGINGGFFAMAAVAATDNKMVGPCKTADMPEVLPDLGTFRWEKLRNRPLVAWNKTEFAIVPFVPESMSNAAVFTDFMPDITDTFLAGVWLVHGGVAREREAMDTFASKDIQDARKRAFLGVMNDGSFVAGASLQSVSSANLAKAIAAAGVAEAVLLDSGFSTSLVYGQSIKAFGHSSKDHPSRPVPHAVVIKGILDPETASMGAADAAVTPSPDEEPRRRRRRRR
jgi:peptidoglycan/xylan/chitin deacetylase (PgdA/CDA1 family)